MTNRQAIVGCVALVTAIVILATILTLWPDKTARQSEPLGDMMAADTVATTIPIPSTPDTAAPVVPVEDTTTTTVPRRVTTTTSESPEPDVAGQVETVDATVSLDDPDMGRWRAIALCEMPGPGGIPSEPWGAHWTFIGSPNGFSGAYGIANVTWRAFGGTEFGPTAGHATWQQQTIVARRIRDRHGYSAWGCGR